MADGEAVEINGRKGQIFWEDIPGTGAGGGYTKGTLQIGVDGRGEAQVVRLNEAGAVSLSNTQIEPLLESVVRELKKMNIYLSKLSDLQVSDEDITL